MARQIHLKDIALVGRTFEECSRIFGLERKPLENEIILDVASGVSSFCAEANAKGYNVTGSDRIYGLNVAEIEEKCKRGLEEIIKQLPGVVDLYVWDFFKDVAAYKKNREVAYRRFIDDFKKHGNERYIQTEYPDTGFKDGQFTLSLMSHFLFLYEDQLDYDFHKKTILELLRITSEEVRIFPIANMSGERSRMVERIMNDEDLEDNQKTIVMVDYEFMRNVNEMMVIKT
jgi:hypothetical protein